MTVQSFAGTWLARGLHQTVWNTLANGDTGSLQANSNMQKQMFQVTGTFGVAGSVTLEGSNLGTTFAPVKDAQGNAITLTAAGIRELEDIPRFIRPNVTAGDGTTALIVTLTERGNR